MLHTLRFSLQNVVYLIMLPFLFSVLFAFYIQVCYNLNVKLRCQKVNTNFRMPHIINSRYIAVIQYIPANITVLSTKQRGS
jgi:hypothetical protein